MIRPLRSEAAYPPGIIRSKGRFCISRVQLLSQRAVNVSRVETCERKVTRGRVFGLKVQSEYFERWISGRRDGVLEMGFLGFFVACYVLSIIAHKIVMLRGARETWLSKRRIKSLHRANGTIIISEISAAFHLFPFLAYTFIILRDSSEMH